MVRAIVGANWGDEGKGKITDMLAKESDIIIRFRAEVMQAIPLSMITANLPFTFFHPACFTSIPPASSAMVWRSISHIWLDEIRSLVEQGFQSPGFWFRTGHRFSCLIMCCLTPTRKRVWQANPLVPPNQALPVLFG